ncbi:MAG: helix-turn-helix transcriptional regulator [Clostridia bacterium]|nr:helix-turn-helix transcriptional regulator [Clostridia bacterium]
MAAPLRERRVNDLAVRMYMHGISQQDVADEMGVSRSSVSLMLNGKRGASDPAGTLEKLSNAVDAIIDRRKSA